MPSALTIRYVILFVARAICSISKLYLFNIRSLIASVLLAGGILSSGCSSIGKIENEPVQQLPTGMARYSSSYHQRQHPVGDTLFVLAFSGGGTRAAALSYGVLEELRDTKYTKDGKSVRLLDEVDRISSVSGGSFTSAYYGLFGDRIFKDFKQDFLYKDVQGELSSLVLGFFDLMRRMFTSESRTEIAIKYYDKHIFKGKTFADLKKSNGPFILINASDLTSQSQFIFIQPQFDFLCSDISNFKVARAVAASSAVPVLFAPVLIKRQDDCNFQKPQWLMEAEKKAQISEDQRLKEAVEALNFHLDKNNPPYVTLLDGGVTDNLGLRTILRSVALSGGIKKMYKNADPSAPPPKQMVVIVVNASTTTDTTIGDTDVLPNIREVLAAVTDIQLHLYNTETNSLLKQQLMQWASDLSTKDHQVTPYFIDIDVSDIKDPEERIFFNKIPTSFSLEKEQADRLVDLAKRMLRQNPEYQHLLRTLNAQRSLSSGY